MDVGKAEFLATSAALTQIICPDFEIRDSDTAIETFIEFESDIHRIAKLEFVEHLVGKPSILLTAADVTLRRTVQTRVTGAKAPMHRPCGSRRPIDGVGG